MRAAGGWRVGLTDGGLASVRALPRWADPPGRSAGPGRLMTNWRPTRSRRRAQERGGPAGQDKADASLLQGQDKCQPDANRDHLILGRLMA